MTDNCFRYIVVGKYADSENALIENVKNDPVQANVDTVVSCDDVLPYSLSAFTPRFGIVGAHTSLNLTSICKGCTDAVYCFCYPLYKKGAH